MLTANGPAFAKPTARLAANRRGGWGEVKRADVRGSRGCQAGWLQSRGGETCESRGFRLKRLPPGVLQIDVNSLNSRLFVFIRGCVCGLW